MIWVNAGECGTFPVSATLIRYVRSSTVGDPGDAVGGEFPFPQRPQDVGERGLGGGDHPDGAGRGVARRGRRRCRTRTGRRPPRSARPGCRRRRRRPRSRPTRRGCSARRPPRITAVGVFPDPPFGLVTAIRTDRGQVACRMARTLCRCASSSFPGFGVARPRLSTLSTVRRRPHSAGGSGGAGGTHPPSASTSVDPARFLREPVPRHHPGSGSGSGGSGSARTSGSSS